MGLLNQTQEQYYSGEKSFTGDGTTIIFTISTTSTAFPIGFSLLGGIANPNVKLYIDGVLLAQSFLDPSNLFTQNYQFKFDAANGWHVLFVVAPLVGANINVVIDNTKYQNIIGDTIDVPSYQFTTLKNVINNFVTVYTGEDKIIPKANRTDVQFHAMRALQELSFDTFKSTKSQEISVSPSLKMILPHDYVNYVKITTTAGDGIERILYPAVFSSDPKNIKQQADGTYSFDINEDGVNDTSDLINPLDSETWKAYQSTSVIEKKGGIYEDEDFTTGDKRYGLDPKHAQINGSFYINEEEGYIHFSSNIAGETITLKYISDSLGTDEEMQVHKFAEEAMYKHIMYAMLSTRMNIPEYVVQRYKKERFAETRKAKLRLSNIKLEEITQILRGKSKQIKH